MRKTDRNVFYTPQQNRVRRISCTAVQVRQIHPRPQICNPASEYGAFDGYGAPGCGAVETVKTTVSAGVRRFFLH